MPHKTQARFSSLSFLYIKTGAGYNPTPFFKICLSERFSVDYLPSFSILRLSKALLIFLVLRFVSK